MTDRTYPHVCHKVGPLFFGWCRQAAGAPVIDTAHTWSVDGWDAGSWVIRFRRTPGRAFQIGLTSVRHIRPPGPRLRGLPLVGRLFRARF